MGIEMSSVVSMKAGFSPGAQPVVNMWWAHTSADSVVIPTSPMIAPL